VLLALVKFVVFVVVVVVSAVVADSEAVADYFVAVSVGFVA